MNIFLGPAGENEARTSGPQVAYGWGPRVALESDNDSGQSSEAVEEKFNAGHTIDLDERNSEQENLEQGLNVLKKRSHPNFANCGKVVAEERVVAVLIIKTRFVQPALSG
ncbi:hypothetical protein C8F04DRAFT_1186893 [Mycena alexandri]|uniref:Uncharacterized protein n=1 Tax=Mycena alexandri TaxID=1745969 RepID=A0AAD6SLW8_9AGAR|nr:hypothetical protein C8F04DRAFT_1186893 [Mycena alexandri]